MTPIITRPRPAPPCNRADIAAAEVATATVKGLMATAR